MIGRFIKSQLRKNKDLILDEVRQVDGFFQLLMKQRNTGIKWSPSEKVRLKQYLRRLVGYTPVLCIFLLPAGFLLIPTPGRSHRQEEARAQARGRRALIPFLLVSSCPRFGPE